MFKKRYRSINRKSFSGRRCNYVRVEQDQREFGKFATRGRFGGLNGINRSGRDGRLGRLNISGRLGMLGMLAARLNGLDNSRRMVITMSRQRCATPSYATRQMMFHNSLKSSYIMLISPSNVV